MHVEIRLCKVEQACAFDLQSFYRVKQLLSSYSGPSNGSEEPVRRTWHGGSLLRLRQTPSFTPELKLQVVVEHLIEMESGIFGAKMDKKQHEARLRSLWNNSAVGTAYHSAEVEEVILAALPSAAADSVVKIRLLQLPPPLDYNAQQVVKRAIGSAKISPHRHDTPLCIGVAKISLRELMSARRTVRIAMQAKRAVVSTVEAHNLDTLITNAMFGRGEKNGSAVLSVQFNGYTFGRVPRGKSIRNNIPTELAKHISTARNSDAPSAPLPSVSSRAADEAAVEMEEEVLNSPAIRFALLPYIALIDVLLRAVDVTSWRVPRKTGMALGAVAIALYSDLFDMLFVLTAALAIVIGLRNISLFYYGPVSECTTSQVAVSLMGVSGTTNFQPFLFSRENPLLNSLLRARVFFSSGLMEDTYYELALAAHLARRSRRQLVVFGLLVCCGFAFLSVGTVVILLTLGAFTAYPVFVNVTSTRRRTRRTKVSPLALIRAAANVIRVPQRHKVVRVVRVAVVRAKTAALSSRPESVAGSASESLQQQFLNCIRQRAESTGVETPSERSEISAKMRENNIAAAHSRARTMDFDFIPSNSVIFASTLDRFQVTHVMRYFVALCFSPSVVESADLANTTAGLRKSSSNAALQRRLCDQLKQARLIGTLLTAALPQSNVISTGGNSATLTQQSGVVMADSKPSAVSKEMQEAFQSFFNSTLALLFYLRQQWTFHPYVTQSSTTKCMPDSMRSVSVLAQPQDLIDAGEDDGVTKALMARRHSMPNPPMVGRFSSGNPVEVSGRVMALYSAYLLQGARLSVYTTPSGCVTVLPLLAPGNCMERFPQPNPCPGDLLNTLDSVWRGETNDTSRKGMDVYFNAYAVLQIITVYKDYWNGAASLAATRSAVRLDSGAAGESNFTNALLRNTMRNTLVSSSPMARQPTVSRSGTTYLARLPILSATARTGLGPVAGSAAQSRGGANPSRADTAGGASAEPAPLHLFPAAKSESHTANVASDTTVSSSAHANSFSNKEGGDPPLLDATCSGGASGRPLTMRERSESSHPNRSDSQTGKEKGDVAEKLPVPKR
ncbi:hypothetical protein GH5_01750 [Leishmania sp. Ghana 2012 LV757]|uniref:hypothetical protein n=1 Tax=Leishmania sp. Ghana 2012 LV757 TaxID=2803181 RepID=UPI001B4C8D89|nr:hypothetical protein GH5_01750 [Leishmania sp. Ghana 2012 LV757]